MTIAPAVIIVMLSFSGHWFGDVENVTIFCLADPTQPEQVTVRWQLSHQDLVLASGMVDLSPQRSSTELQFKTPQVRVITAATFSYQVFAADGAARGSGTRPVRLYPPPGGEPMLPVQVGMTPTRSAMR